MKESSQDFIAYFKNNKHQKQEVLTAQKLVKQLHCPLLFKKQFAFSRKTYSPIIYNNEYNYR